ncbi:SPASM domain-containing protein [Pseudomonas syringae pv. actinidiae]|nr:SPASM domain-containing protein [Pseudomonas syringae pv. actinidiae]
MSVDSYLTGLHFIYEFWKRVGLDVTHLTIEYVGGEVLLLSKTEISACVNGARKFFADRGINVVDGVQSNLIGSSERVDFLFDLFENRVGTSIDSFSDKRKFKGSAEKYRVFFMESEQKVSKRLPSKVPGIFTMDSDTVEHAILEVQKAMDESRDLMIRPVFGGGSEVKLPSVGDIGYVYEETLDRWWMKSSVRLEPMYSLVRKRLSNRLGAFKGENFDYCSFQSNCTLRSLSMEPNGDLFICQDMADANREVLGNALNGEFDFEKWKLINQRPYRMDADCYACPYFKECQGGCLLKSLESGGGIFGKSTHCGAWKLMFAKIDQLIDSSDEAEMLMWIEEIEQRAIAA